MKIKLFIMQFLIGLCLISCKKEEEEPLSNQVRLLTLDLIYNGSTFRTEVEGTEIKLLRQLPYECNELEVSRIQISEGATCSIVGRRQNLC